MVLCNFLKRKRKRWAPHGGAANLAHQHPLPLSVGLCWTRRPSPRLSPSHSPPPEPDHPPTARSALLAPAAQGAELSSPGRRCLPVTAVPSAHREVRNKFGLLLHESRRKNIQHHLTSREQHHLALPVQATWEFLAENCTCSRPLFTAVYLLSSFEEVEKAYLSPSFSISFCESGTSTLSHHP